MKNMQSLGNRILANKTTIVFAPHADDDVLGVGGTIAKKVAAGERVVVCVATDGDDWLVRRTEEMKACGILGIPTTDIEFMKLPDLRLDKVSKAEINGKVLDLLRKYKPDEVYTPHIADLHPDHRALTEAVMVAIRPKYDFAPKFAFTYETLSETGWNYLDARNEFSPNVYVDITDTIEVKKNALMAHSSQMKEYPSCRSIQAVEALALYRGTQAEMEFAEAFTLIRWYRK